MSFVEKHKAWLLPLLGVGIAAVVLMNVKLLSAKPAPATPDAPQPAPAAPEPAPAAAPAAPAPEEQGADLWADLRPLAVVPPELAQEGALRDRARQSLADSQFRVVAPEVSHPALKEEVVAKAPKTAEPEAPPQPPPELDFLLRTPGGGARAWIAGRSYAQGQTLAGTPYRVKRIGTSRVLLDGPGGATERSTNPLERPAHGHPAPAENP